jgi:hypothetical protein
LKKRVALAGSDALTIDSTLGAEEFAVKNNF